MSNVSFYTRSNQLSENTQGVLITVTSGNVQGFTQNTEKCPSVNAEMERGSIILNKNLNRIEIEGFNFANYGYFRTHALILDPPKPPNKCVCMGCDCSSKKGKCRCPLTPIESGVVKSVNIFVPPGVNQFVVYTRAFQNWRYGCNLNVDDPSRPIENLNCRASYQSVYRFAWQVDLVKRTNNIYSIYAIGPHLNYELEVEQCVSTTPDGTLATTNGSLTESSDNLIASTNPTSSSESKKVCCEYENDEGETSPGVCVQPFYNNLFLNEYSLSSHSALVEGAYAAGSGNRQTANADFGFPNNFLLGNSMNIPAIDFGLTTSASFVVTNPDKARPNENEDTSNLTQVTRRQTYGTLTLFTNNNH